MIDQANMHPSIHPIILKDHAFRGFFFYNWLKTFLFGMFGILSTHNIMSVEHYRLEKIIRNYKSSFLSAFKKVEQDVPKVFIHVGN